MINARYLTGSYSNSMETITSKRHLLNFYGILFVCIFLLVCGIVMLLKDHATDKGKLTLEGLLFAAFSIYLLITVLKKSPKITIDKNHIQFNNKSFRIQDIKEITLVGQYNYYILAKIDGAKIVFNDQSEKYIFDFMYSNTSKIKLILDFIVNNNKYKSVEKVQTDISSEHFYDYKGILIVNFRSIFLFLMLLMFTSMLFSDKNLNKGFPLLFIASLIFLFQFQFHYFQLNKKYFRIKNQLRFWKNEMYNIEDIKEVTFETGGKAPNFLKIIFKDYTSKKYYAATLGTRQWKKLQKALEELNIIVKNYI